MLSEAYIIDILTICAKSTRAGIRLMSSSDDKNSPIESYGDAASTAENRAHKDEVRKKVAIAREILSDKSVPRSVIEQDNQKFGREASFVVTVFAFLVAVILIAWYLWEESYLHNEEDLIYNMGLVGGIMMLLQFVYSARKRSTKMRRWGKLKVWFGIHTFIGLSAPIIIIFHSRFELQSINGTVAFVAMLIVVFSGVVGRYLYSQVNFDLSAGRHELKEYHVLIQERIIRPNAGVSEKIEKQLKGFMINAFSSPKSIFHSFKLAVSIGFKSKTLYLRLTQMSYKPMAADGMPSLEQSIPVFAKEEKRLLKSYLNLLSKMARCNAYKQLFALWRVGHIPLIYLLLFTGLAHVLAVHMY